MNTLAQNLFMEINRFRIEDAAPSEDTPPYSPDQGGKTEEGHATQQPDKTDSKETDGKSDEKQAKPEKEPVLV